MFSSVGTTGLGHGSQGWAGHQPYQCNPTVVPAMTSLRNNKSSRLIESPRAISWSIMAPPHGHFGPMHRTCVALDGGGTNRCRYRTSREAVLRRTHGTGDQQSRPLSNARPFCHGTVNRSCTVPSEDRRVPYLLCSSASSTLHEPIQRYCCYRREPRPKQQRSLKTSEPRG